MKTPDKAHVNPIDRDVAEAFAALDRTSPEVAVEELSSRVLARLDAHETGIATGKQRPPRNVARARAARAPVARDDSGLLEIKALAGAAKRRISEREAAESDVDDSAVVLAAAYGGLRAVALPDPLRRRGKGKGAGVGSAEDRLRAETRSSAPFWVLGSVATIAAVAAVAVFVFDIGRHRQPGLDRSGEEAVRERAAARAPSTSGAAPATPSPSSALPPPPRSDPSPPSDQAVVPEQPAVKLDPSAQSGPEHRGRGSEDREARRERARPVEGGEPAASAGGPVAGPSPHGGDTSNGEAGGKEEGASLEEMLDGVAGQGKRAAESEEDRKQKEAEAIKHERRELDRDDVARAMDEIRTSVQRCSEIEQTRGTVTVKFVVAPTGQVSSARPSGSHAASRTGDCVAAAVMQASFRAFDGAPASFTYPFFLTGSP